ncbi:hypothetical protein ACHWQZ_G011501 [Mnemiopsis leidyi]
MSNFAYVRSQETDEGMSTAAAAAPADLGTPSNPYEKMYHYDDEDYYDPHCFFSSGLAQNRKRLGFIATCSTVQCKDAGSAGYDPLLPFKEDLAEWLYKMIRAEIAPNRFFPELQSGVHLCKLGIHMQKMAVKYRREHPEDTSLVPPKPPNLKYANATRKSPPFYCRDNISNFLDWSIEFGVKHSCRFETDDLTLRKNDRQIVIHLMEVGRLGVKFGIEPPTLIKLEMSLEDPLPPPVKGASTLDEKVQACAAECSCSVPFKVNRVSEGRYKVGEGRSIVFVRVLRSHVMVRVGGGWETLSAYFSKMDPCRSPMDSFGGKTAASPTGKLKQRFESNEELDQPMTPRGEREPEPEVEEDCAPPPVVTETVTPVQSAVPPTKPKRPVASPSPAAIAATSDTIKKPGPPRTRSPTKSPLRQSASTPVTPRAAPAAPRPASPRKAPAAKPSPTVPRESVTSPTPRPISTRAPAITPRQTKASLLRTSSPSAIKTPAPTAGGSPTKAAPNAGSGGISHPPWKFVPNSHSPVTKTSSAPQKPASRISGEAGPSTPNFQRPNRASTLDRKEPPTQNKRLIPVGGKNLPKSDTYNRATQNVSGKPKITSPELIRRAMEIMKDNGEVEEEEKVVRTPTEPALIAAIEEIAEEEYQCEAGETVEVEVPDRAPEPSTAADQAPDSGVGTLAESKPRVTENAGAGGDTLQDVSDMITDDQDRSEMENLEELPSDDAGYEVQDIPTQELHVEPVGLYCEDDLTEEFEPTIEAESVSEVAAEAPSQLIAQIEKRPEVAESQPEIEALSGRLPESDYEGGTTEDELNEAVGSANYASKMDVSCRHDSSSSTTSGQGDEDEPAPVITESMIQRMEEYMRAKSELEDTIDDFEKAARQLSNESVDDAIPDVLEIQLEQEDELKVEEGPFVEAELEVVSDVPIDVNDTALVKSEPGQLVDKVDQQVEEEVPKADEDLYYNEPCEVLVTEGDDEKALPEPAIVEEESASSGTASPPAAVADEIGPENASFAEKVKKLEHMIKTHPQKIPRPSDESQGNDIEVDNLVIKDIPADLLQVEMNEIKRVEATRNVDVPPPIETINDAEMDPEPSKLEDVLAESLEHIPAPIEETDEISPAADIAQLAHDDSAEISIEASSKVELLKPAAEEASPTVNAPTEVTKIVVKRQDQPPMQKIVMSSWPVKEEVVLKEKFKEVSPPTKAVEVELEDDLDIEDLEVIKEAEAEEEVAITEHPLSESEEVVMKPDKTPLPNSSTLNMAPRRYSFEAEKQEEVDRPARKSKRSLNSSGHTSDSDRSTASEKGVSDTSSGYHEDYETSDGDELGTSYDKVPNVIMEQDRHTRSILKGSMRESIDSGKQSLTSTPSLPKQRMKSEDDDVFEEERAKGLNLPTEGHVREAVFTKAIESAINPLAYGIQIPNMGELQSASIVLPSKKAIRKASDGEYDYHGRRTNLQKVISKPHTEKTDMEWDERDEARAQDKMDGQTRDEKVQKWSGTLRSSQKKKKPFRAKKITEDDILNAIAQQSPARGTCPVHAAGPPVTGPTKRRVPSTKRPGTATARRVAPATRPATRPSTAPKTATTMPATNPQTTNVKARVDTRRPSASNLPVKKPLEKGSKAIAVKPASRTSNPQEVMSIAASPTSGPPHPLKNKT